MDNIQFFTILGSFALAFAWMMYWFKGEMRHLKSEMDELKSEIRELRIHIVGIDKRVLRIEGMFSY